MEDARLENRYLALPLASGLRVDNRDVRIVSSSFPPERTCSIDGRRGLLLLLTPAANKES
jgi:hypothetical protein